ncbi:MAG: hypothetical protein ACXWKJ_01580 [Telluria sp.]
MATLIWIAAGAAVADDAPPRPAPLAPVVTEDAIRQAVREILAEERKNQAGAAPAAPAFGAERPPALRKFDALVEDAVVPYCLHPDGLKRQPTGIGPFQLGGYLALPFIGVAKLRGVCR